MKQVLQKYKTELSKKTLGAKEGCKLSYFTHAMDLNKEEVILFDSLFLEIKKISKEDLDNIKSDNLNRVNKELIQELAIKGMLISRNFTLSDLIKPLKKIFSATAFNNLYLIPSSSCNLRCKHCYVETYNSNFSSNLSMSREETKNAIDLFFRLSAHGLRERTSDIKKITFFGGEPLLNVDLLCFSVGYIRKNYGQKHAIIIVTNGTLLNKELIDFFKKNNVQLVVSLDGPKEINRAYRDNMHYDKIIANLKYLSDISCNFSISCTLNPINYSEILEILEWFREEIKPKGIDLNLPLPPLSNELKISDLTDLMWKSFLWGEKIGLHINPVATKLLCLKNKIFYYDDCGQNGGQLDFFPNNRVGVCHAMETNKTFTEAISKYDYREITSNENFQKWNDCNCLNKEDCLSCIALGLCGGGCKFNNLVKKSDIWINDEDYCYYQKEITIRLLRYLYGKR